METVGAYAFVTSDWKEKDYPLDLWLEHHLKLFDQVALVTYGKVDIAPHPKLKTKTISPVSESRFSFYIDGKSEAQKLLDTDWKVLLDIDEFMGEKIDVSKLNKKLAYALRYRNLYGNVFTEIENEFSKYQYRVHFSNRAILGDGANVAGPLASRYSFSIPDTLKAVIRKLFKKVIPSLEKTLRTKPILVPTTSFEIWQTGTARDPKALSEKWRVQINREIREGINYSKDYLKWMAQEGFDYKAFDLVWKGSRIIKVDPHELPDVLKENFKRFNWVTFDEKEYSKG